MKIGYARVSTQDRNLDLQLRALDQAGCEKVFKDRGISGTQRDRPQLKKALAATSPGGKLFFHMIGALAEFERYLIIERTKAGMQAARKRGQHLGRPRKLNGSQLEHARELIDQGRSRNEAARLLKVDPATLYRRLRNGK